MRIYWNKILKETVGSGKYFNTRAYLVLLGFFLALGVRVKAQEKYNRLVLAEKMLEEADSLLFEILPDERIENLLHQAKKIFKAEEVFDKYIKALNKLASIKANTIKTDEQKANFFDFVIGECKTYLPDNHPELGFAFKHKAAYLMTTQNFLHLGQSMALQDSVIAIFEVSNKWDEVIEARCNKVIVGTGLSNYKKLRKDLLEAKTLLNQKERNNTRLRQLILEAEASLSVRIGDFGSAVHAGREALKLSGQWPSGRLPAAYYEPQIFLYTILGQAYSAKGEFQKAIDCHGNALRIAKNYYKDGLGYLGIATLFQLASNYRAKTEFATAKVLLLQVDSLLKTPESMVEANLKFSTGLSLINVYTQLEKYDSALVWYERTEQLRKYWGFSEELALFSRSWIALNKKQYKSAIPTFRKIYNSHSKALDFIRFHRTDVTAEAANALAMCFAGIQEYDSALYYKNQGIRIYERQVAGPRKNLQGTQTLYPNDIIIKFQYEKSNYLIGLAKQRNRSREVLKQAMEALETSAALIDQFRKEMLSIQLKRSLPGFYRGVYENAIGISLSLQAQPFLSGYPEKAFQFAEKARAMTLLIAQWENLAKSDGSIPAHFVESERNLQQDLAFYRSKVIIEEAKGEQADSLKLAVWKGYLFSLERELDVWKTTVKTSFPEYLKKQARPESIQPSQVRDSILQEHEALIEYFIGEDELFTFVITENGIKTYRDSLPPGLDSLVRVYHRNLSDHNFIHDSVAISYRQFTSAANALYNLLLAKPLQEFPELERLLIIPDGILGQIPFEPLLIKPAETDRVDFVNLPYLFRDYEIRYSYSASLLQETLRYPPKAENEGCLAFAPTYQESKLAANRGSFQRLRDTPGELPGAQREIAQLARLDLPGRYVLGENANETQFKALAPKYRLLHLALHGKANQDDPDKSSIRFSALPTDTCEDDILYAFELASLPLKAELAVLSACETGTGEVLKGEGIMSLGRDFMAAGVSSVIVTLWSVDDRSSSKLMELFYDNASAGEPIAQALHHAKLEFMESADSRTAHPFYWAGYVLYGQSQEIEFQPQDGPGTGSYVAGGLGLLALLGAAGWTLRRKRNRKQEAA